MKKKMGYPPRPLETRFFEKVKKTNSCWIWTGKTDKSKGYGMIWIGAGKTRSAHRVSYLIHIGEIPEHLQIDHLCRNRACVNPTHMEPVSIKENVLRGNGPSAINAKKKMCKRGHKLSGKNLHIYYSKTGRQRVCKLCKKITQNERRKIR